MDKNKLENLLKDLKRLKATSEGGVLGGLLFELTEKTSMAKGEKGDTPQRGIDYMTDNEINQIIDDMARKVQSLIRLPKDGETPIKGKDYFTDKEIKKIIDEATKIVQSQIRIPEDGKNGIDGINGADGSSDLAETIVAKLESIEENDDKLKISAIKDLEDELKKLRKHIDGKVIYTGGSSGGLGGHVQYHDLSSKLDGGVTRVFGMPAFARILSVQLSSFPNILRPLIDWTSDASASTLTVTAEIPDTACPLVRHSLSSMQIYN